MRNDGEALAGLPVLVMIVGPDQLSCSTQLQHMRRRRRINKQSYPPQLQLSASITATNDASAGTRPSRKHSHPVYWSLNRRHPTGSPPSSSRLTWM